MARKLSRKQIVAGFGGPRARAALLARSRSSRKRAGPKTQKKVNRKMARRSTTRKRSRRRQKMTVAEGIATANAVIQVGEPFIPAAQLALSGDVPGAVAAAKPALKEAGSFRNLGQAAAPFIGVRVFKWAAGLFGKSSGPRVGKRRLW